MDIRQIRLINLNIVLLENFRGVKAHLAEAMGVAPNNISRYFSSHPEHGRAISTKMARRIEGVTRRPEGWMDQLHEMEGEDDISKQLEGLSDRKLGMIRRHIEFVKSIPEDQL